MKKLMLGICLMFGGATLVSAQEQQDQPSQTEIQQDQGQQISVSELPDGVTAKLESPDYSGWTVGTAYKKMDDAQNEIYVVEMRKGTETKKVKFDSDGNQLEGDKHKDKSENYRDDATEQDATLEDAADETDNAVTPDQK